MANLKPKKVVLDWESTYGQTPASPTPFVLMVNSSGITASEQTGTDNVIGGDIDTGGQIYKKSDDIAGSLTMPMYYEQIGVLLKAILGSPTTADNGDGTFTHTFVSTECIPSYCQEDTLSNTCDGGSDFIKLFNGLRANTMGINVSPDGDYNVELSSVGSTGKDSLVDGISPIGGTEIALGTTRIRNSHATLLIDATSYKLAKDFTMNIDRGTVADKVIEAGAIAEDRQFMVSGSMSSLFDETTYVKAKAKTEVSITVNFTDGTNILTFTVAQANMSFKDEARSYGEKYPLNIDWSGYKTTASEKLKVVLTNGVDSY